MTITGAGKVGIGEDDPAERLEVNGNICLTEGATRNIYVAENKTVGNDLKVYAGDASSCFPGNTKINTPGGYKLISDINSGDILLAYNPETRRFSETNVVSIWSIMVDSYYVLNDGLKVTAEHPFFTGSGWKTARELVVGDELFTIEGRWIVLDSKFEVDEEIEVYNMHVGAPNTFFAEDILVHNKDEPVEGFSGGDLYLYGGAKFAGITAVDGDVILAHNGESALGKVGIGTSSPSYQLQLSLNSAAKPTSSSWTIASDGRLKKDISPYESGIEDIMKIDPIWFTYTGEAGLPEDRGVGVIAQDLEKIAPYMVNNWTYKDDNGVETEYLAVDNGPMTYMLINAVQEQQAQIEELKANRQRETRDIIDFGRMDMETNEIWVMFSEDFASQLQDGTIPIVTVTPNCPSVVLCIAEKTNKGFKIVGTSGNENGFSFDWIAMASVNDENAATHQNIHNGARSETRDEYLRRAKKGPYAEKPEEE